MNDVEIKQTLDLAKYLSTGPQAKTVACANIVMQLCEDECFGDRELRDRARLAGRIYEEMTAVDEPRYNMTDYADAVVHARAPVSVGKLLALDAEKFAAAIVWLATDKRETYEDREHCQEPLEFDIGE